jgi:hypothetical protein
LRGVVDLADIGLDVDAGLPRRRRVALQFQEALAHLILLARDGVIKRVAVVVVAPQVGGALDVHADLGHRPVAPRPLRATGGLRQAQKTEDPRQPRPRARRQGRV